MGWGEASTPSTVYTRRFPVGCNVCVEPPPALLFLTVCGVSLCVWRSCLSSGWQHVWVLLRRKPVWQESFSLLADLSEVRFYMIT